MTDQFTVTIESVDFEGKGIARLDGKTVFVEGALKDEDVVIEIIKHKPSFAKAKLITILKPSPHRVAPQCPNFGRCGGCSMQHISFNEQITLKQQVLIDNLHHIGKVHATNILPPLAGISWGYRHRARLSARYVLKKGGALVGFREKASQYVTDMNECHVLPEHVSQLLPALRKLVASLSIRERVPQIEVAIGTASTVLVIRNMEPLTTTDEQLIIQFIDQYSSQAQPLQIWLQPKGPDSCYPFYPLTAPQLSYQIQRFKINMPYYPTEFTQVNPYLNEKMVGLAMDLLEATATDTIADFFCGIGNFTLPIARQAKRVIGIEGSDVLVKRALDNATHNGLDPRVSYQVCNLFTIDSEWLTQLGKFDKWLIDPPRDGAIELIKAITPATAPQRIVYVSCNPATLARDAGVLVHVHGYRLAQAGIMNMFPHTSHVESIAVFNRD